MYQVFEKCFSSEVILIIGVLFTFLLTFIMLALRPSFLPKDQGRAFAVNGEFSKGKLRGVGLIFTLTFLVGCGLFMPVERVWETVVFGVLVILIMLSGYLDDASEKPWNEYKKGLIDLVLAVATMVLYVYCYGSTIMIFGSEMTLPAWLYCLLGVILIWVSINVTNCTDGVDGLLGSVSSVTILSYVLLFGGALSEFCYAACYLLAALCAYLFFNTSPSSMLMGDAGSRAIGYFIALLALKSGHPLLWLLLGIVMILDGGLGLLKISLKRFLKICILKNTRTPLHDHCRKNKGWSDTQVVVRFTLLQVLACVIAMLLL